MKQVTWEELIGGLHPVAAKTLVERIANDYPTATHAVVAVNMQLDSSRAGDKTAMLVGPDNTYRSPEDCEGKWLYDLPSQRQYFQCYAVIPKEVTDASN